MREACSNFSSPLPFGMSLLRCAEYRKVSGGGAILLSGDSMKPIVNSQITVADCTFRNIVAPGLPGISDPVTMNGGFSSSLIAVVNNNFVSEIDSETYGDTFIAQGRWYTSNMTVSENTVSVVTLSKAAFGGRMGFIAFSAMKGLTVAIRRNNFTASGPTKDGYSHMGIWYLETGRDWSIPYLDDYTGISEQELRTTFGKGEVTIEDNVFSAPMVHLDVSSQHSINVFIKGNLLTAASPPADGVVRASFVAIRPNRGLPTITEVVGNTITTDRTRAYVSLNGLLSSHSTALIEGNTLRSGNSTLSAIQLHGSTYEPFTVADATVSVAIKDNIVFTVQWEGSFWETSIRNPPMPLTGPASPCAATLSMVLPSRRMRRSRRLRTGAVGTPLSSSPSPQWPPPAVSFVKMGRLPSSGAGF